MRKKLLSIALAVFLAASSMPVSSVQAAEVPDSTAELTETTTEVSDGFTEPIETTEGENAAPEEASTTDADATDVTEAEEEDATFESQADTDIQDNPEAEETEVADTDGLVELSEENFPDEDMRRAIPSSALTTVDGQKYVDIKKCTYLNIPGVTKGTIDVKGISLLTELKSLYIVSNQWSAGSTGNQQIKNLDLSENLNLESLRIGGKIIYGVPKVTGIGTIDVSKNTALKDIQIVNEEITSLDLSNNVNLETVDLDCANLESLKLPNQGKMTELFIESDKAVGVDYAKEVNLTSLVLDYPIENSLNLAPYTKLTKLRIGNPSSYCSGLRNLTLPQNSELKILNVFASVSSLDVSTYTELMHLYIGGVNSISSLNLSSNKKLNSLGIYDSNIKDIDLSNNTELESLHLSNLPIQKLDLSHNSKLFEMYLSKLTVDTMDLSRNGDLVVLYSSNIQTKKWD